MHRNMKMLCLLFLGLLTLALAGCGEVEKKSSRVAVAFPSSSESWRRNGDALRDVLVQEGFTVDYQYVETAQEQRALITQMLGKDQKYLIIGAVDPGNWRRYWRRPGQRESRLSRMTA